MHSSGPDDAIGKQLSDSPRKPGRFSARRNALLVQRFLSGHAVEV